MVLYAWGDVFIEILCYSESDISSKPFILKPLLIVIWSVFLECILTFALEKKNITDKVAPSSYVWLFLSLMMNWKQ